MSTVTFADFRVGQTLRILTGWEAGRTCVVRSITQQRITVALDNGMLTDWRLDITGWMPRVEVLR